MMNSNRKLYQGRSEIYDVDFFLDSKSPLTAERDLGRLLPKSLKKMLPNSHKDGVVMMGSIT